MAGPSATASTITAYAPPFSLAEAISCVGGFTGGGNAPPPTTGQLWPRGNVS